MSIRQVQIFFPGIKSHSLASSTANKLSSPSSPMHNRLGIAPPTKRLRIEYYQKRHHVKPPQGHMVLGRTN
ncbi:hypothetical protein HN51_023214 [Arachis hypogaea]